VGHLNQQHQVEERKFRQEWEEEVLQFQEIHEENFQIEKNVLTASVQRAPQVSHTPVRQQVYHCMSVARLCHSKSLWSEQIARCEQN
jgi:hypothetical protein